MSQEFTAPGPVCAAEKGKGDLQIKVKVDVGITTVMLPLLKMHMLYYV